MTDAASDVCSKPGSLRPTTCVLSGEIVDIAGEHNVYIDIAQYASRDDWVGQWVEIRAVERPESDDDDE
jgi:hypothetical protein